MKFNKDFFIKKILPVLGGATLGFLYYQYIGCNGSCPISGNPYISTLYGAGLGLIFVFPHKKKE